MKTRTLALLAVLATAPACRSAEADDAPRAAVASAELPEIRYYVIADT